MAEKSFGFYNGDKENEGGEDMHVSHTAARALFGKGIDKVLRETEEERQKTFLELVDLAQNYMGDHFAPESYENVRRMVADPENKWMRYINRALNELDPNVVRTNALNLGYEAAFHGTKTIRKMREIHQCNIPWLILMDPTSACNLRCTGCWAAEYGHQLNLDFDTLDSIVSQGKEIGVYFYMLTGGEPLMRKEDIIRLCRKHSDCAFHAFTNGTLVDDAFCEKMSEVGNLSLSISLEGFEEVNDARRGAGTFDRVMEAMDTLKRHGQLFGTSICYTSKNIETVTSDEFLDMIIEKGCRFTWYFHYMPVGNDASPELLPTAEQREYMYHRVREIRGKEGGKPIFAMDFQNDGEFVGGCIAGGRNYFHINANGDAEPCVFIHYSNANIKEVSLLNALKQPLFMAYRDGQPFNSNHLRPCPMLENPEILQRMVKETGAKSTDLQSPETAEHLCEKCRAYEAQWTETAEQLWGNNKHFETVYKNYKKK
jgi:MoaA/NifB/PqqE/SkfB family radical SAM enzyme